MQETRFFVAAIAMVDADNMLMRTTSFESVIIRNILSIGNFEVRKLYSKYFVIQKAKETAFS